MWQSSDTIPQDTLHHIALCCLEGSTPQDGLKRTATCKAKRFIPVYRLGEDGDLLLGRWWYAVGLGVKSSLL